MNQISFPFSLLIDDKLNLSSQNDSIPVASGLNKSGDNLVSSLVRMKPSVASSQDMLSFEEWRTKISEQMEKNKIQSPPSPSSSSTPFLLISSSTINDPNQKDEINSKSKINRARNFASNECGAKIVDSNNEANFVHRFVIIKIQRILIK